MKGIAIDKLDREKNGLFVRSPASCDSRDSRLSTLEWSCLLLILFLLVFAPVHADAALDDLVAKMQKKYENLESLKADFTQTYQSKRFSDRLVEAGVVYFQKGGLMKWEYEQPEQKVFLSDGLFYLYYVQQDKQLVKVPVKEKGDQRSPALFLAGRGNFQKDFRAEWSDPRPGSHLVKLIPIKTQSDFQYLVVSIDPVRGLIQRLLVVDAYDNRTEYVFQQIQENPKLPANFFAFQPPPGTDIIYQRGDATEGME
jgi:outer membrane lipoprotein carrier protein